MSAEQAKCDLCGEPMPEGETMFKFHGYSGPCPKPPVEKPRRNLDAAEKKLSEHGIIWEEGKGYVFNGKADSAHAGKGVRTE